MPTTADQVTVTNAVEVPSVAETPNGAGIVYVNAPCASAVVIGVFTTTSCAPAAPAAVTAEIEVADITLKLLTAMPPIVTLLASVKLVPSSTIVVPPLNIPEFGTTLVMVGALVR